MMEWLAQIINAGGDVAYNGYLLYSQHTEGEDRYIVRYHKWHSEHLYGDLYNGRDLERALQLLLRYAAKE